MKRRDFITAAAGMSAGGMLTGAAGVAMAQDRPAEKVLQIYKCQKCSTMVEILHPGKSSLAHCGVAMKLLVEKTEDLGKEKHVPVIEKTDGGYKVKVGSVPHPMTESHYITAIQLITDDRICTVALKPTDKPEAVFCIDAKKVSARAYCNLHGLWKST